MFFKRGDKNKKTQGKGGAHLATGKRGEDLAARHLKQHGLVILQRNYRIAGGELDIVAQDGDVLVFVEVKTAATTAFGEPESWVTPFKQKQLMKLASAYRQREHCEAQDCRIDVIGVILPKDAPPVITHLPNAFGP